ncbi:RNA polymerase sigma factor SigJ [Stappia sp. WLB 29]|uniref:RNA polymerase sigma factor SigJ n=1 Tax=Stappia sp. WLB 29 TaxID=2925220 RepID=UPI0020BEE907|nr:RNA polymerase sigma factor SigJ [Stappia sp. WLB 29]
MQHDAANDAVDTFEKVRGRLTGLAYRMTGLRADAEDAVQDAWLRWQRTDRSKVEDPEAFLSTVVTRLCLDRLRRRRREQAAYDGPWLPEPLLGAAGGAPAGPVEETLASDISFALMLALERLSPLERAAFLLHDVFDMGFGEIAEMLGRSEAACRQLASRARDNIRKARPRFSVDAREHEAVATAFLNAARQDDVEGLSRLLAEGAVLHSDGGGQKIAARNLISGALRVAKFLAGVARKFGSTPAWRCRVLLGGLPGELTLEADGTRQATAVEVADGRVQAVYVLRNPDKLARLWVEAGGPDEMPGPAATP